jgi:hypothetical protein
MAGDRLGVGSGERSAGIPIDQVEEILSTPPRTIDVSPIPAR